MKFPAEAAWIPHPTQRPSLMIRPPMSHPMPSHFYTGAASSPPPPLVSASMISYPTPSLPVQQSSPYHYSSAVTSTTYYNPAAAKQAHNGTTQTNAHIKQHTALDRIKTTIKEEDNTKLQSIN